MKEQKEIKIKYRTGIQHHGSIKGEPYREYTHDFVVASTNHVKRFNNALMLLAGIEGCEKHLMDWLADNMTNGNYVNNNEITRKAFISFHEKYGKGESKKYSDKTVSIAFQRLSSADFLIPVTRGLFMVNPLYYYAGDDASRINAIKMIMEFKSGVETKITVHTK
jgi:hypothetical protein